MNDGVDYPNFNTSPSTRGFEIKRNRLPFLRFQYQPLHEGLRIRSSRIHRTTDFNTSPSTRGFLLAIGSTYVTLFQYQPLHEGLPLSLLKSASLALFQYQPLHEGLQ